MEPVLHPYLTQPDAVVIKHLIRDKQDVAEKRHGIQRDYDKESISLLESYNDPTNPKFVSTIFTSWDDKDIPRILKHYAVHPYARMAMRVVRHPTDVVFLTHIIQYLTFNLGSAVRLYYSFSYIHGAMHLVYTIWCMGPYTLLLHNHVHHNGVLADDWAWLDLMFPYIIGPLLGHTWNSYYYHHVKHHHVENNGPADLSSTIRYQRDDVLHFLLYFARFLFFIWLELPIYFVKKGKTKLALRAGSTELFSYIFLLYLIRLNPRASTFVFLLPFLILRFALMVGNWGQHALVDEIDPTSDFGTSITVIDVTSNRFCFNDGYHTAHHRNPQRHWREQPVHFLRSKEAYCSGRALVFYNIDYLMITVKLLMKDYLYLADRLIPIGSQTDMSKRELAGMLRAKTKKFSEEDIAKKFKTSTTVRA